MLGWMNDSLEKYVISQFDVKTWHSIKAKAGLSHVVDGGYVKLDSYNDQTTMDLILAAAAVAKVEDNKEDHTAAVPTFLQGFGRYFLHYLQKEGFDSLLKSCQGRCLKEMLTNINEIHAHVQSTCPKPMTSIPQFWVEETQADDGEQTEGSSSSLVLHYHSQRGNFMSPFVEGMVMEIASTLFDVSVKMTRITQTQGHAADSSGMTASWIITASKKEDQYKLIMGNNNMSSNHIHHQEAVADESTTARDTAATAVEKMKCPFSGMKMSSAAPRRVSSSITMKRRRVPQQQHQHHHPNTTASRRVSESMFDLHGEEDEEDSSDINVTTSTTSTSITSASSLLNDQEEPRPRTKIGLSGSVTDNLFPYHVMIDNDFQIVQVGKDLPSLLHYSCEEDMIGQSLGDVLRLKRPTTGGMSWDWKCLQLLETQSFELEPTTTTLQQHKKLSFKATIVHVSDSLVMLILTPHAQTLAELNDMDMTINDLPLHGGYRDTVFLGEHLSTQMNQSLRVEKLTRHLRREKGLLESLLPQHAAENLRKGKMVQPMLHKRVTFFFSDIVGFTSICNKLYPWQVIEMLNQLYCVMDFLAAKLGLFKIETIGDAYVCCSGLPYDDPHHAKNVANFAVAVNHCAKLVLSPLDNKTPIQLRIGIHTGQSASGVVGVTNPRYCVFGDTVNTTARHESSGMPGKIHCSDTTQAELMTNYKGSFNLTERGIVEMKGLGHRKTFWLEGGQGNDSTNQTALSELEEEVKDLLLKADFKRAYCSHSLLEQEEQVSKTDKNEESNSSSNNNGRSHCCKEAATQAPKTTTSTTRVPIKQEFRLPRLTSVEKNSAPSVHDMARIGSIMRRIKNGETAPSKNFSWTTSGATTRGATNKNPQRRTQSFSAAVAPPPPSQQAPPATNGNPRPRTKSFSAASSSQQQHNQDVGTNYQIVTHEGESREGPMPKNKRSRDSVGIGGMYVCAATLSLRKAANAQGQHHELQALTPALKRRKTVTSLIRGLATPSLHPKPKEAPAG